MILRTHLFQNFYKYLLLLSIISFISIWLINCSGGGDGSDSYSAPWISDYLDEYDADRVTISGECPSDSTEIYWKNDASGESGSVQCGSKTIYCTRCWWGSCYDYACGTMRTWVIQFKLVPAIDNKIILSATPEADDNRIFVISLRDQAQPNVVSILPERDNYDVPTNTVFSVTFNEEMDSSTLTSNDFYVIDEYGSYVNGTISYSDKTVTFTPYTFLEGLTKYTTYITKNASDLTGNPLQHGESWEIKTAILPDPTPPTVTSTNPPHMSECVPVDTPISVNFSEKLDLSTINSDSFYAKDEMENVLILNGNFAKYVKIAVLPVEQFTENSTYTSTITTGVKDLAGNPLESDYVWQFKTTQGVGAWRRISSIDAPSSRTYHTVVWTGSEMLIWGGIPYSSGARYNPNTDSWTPIASLNAPSHRSMHVAFWTGTEMLIWGGEDNGSYQNTGARYDPSDDIWSTISTIGVPNFVEMPSVIWSGSEMIVWGPARSGTETQYLGARYNTHNDIWTPISTLNSPQVSGYAVWNNGEMLLISNNVSGSYSPSTDSWTSISSPYEPVQYPFELVTSGGDEVILTGKGEEDGISTALMYSPLTDSWIKMDTSCGFSERSHFTSVWTGSEMIIWGGKYPGYRNFESISTGSKFTPITGQWAMLSLTNAPYAMHGHTAVWTGSEMIVWGTGGGYAYTP